MSEGPNVIQWARALRCLVGAPLVAVKLPSGHGGESRTLLGHHLTAVDTHGKHLLARLSDGRTLNCHGMLDGHWRVSPVGASQRPPEKSVCVRLRTAGHEALFVNGRVAELLTAEQLARHPRVAALGPDVMSPQFSYSEVWPRVHALGAEIAEAIVNQNVVAGIGNIYKCEGLFLAGIDPRRPASDVTRDEVDDLWEALIPLMWHEADCVGRWTTLPDDLARTGEQHWVYGRRGRPCFRCGNGVRMVKQGRYRRTTFFCALCQR